MKISIVLDIDVQESGYTEDDLKDNIVDFTRDLIINGADNEEVAFTLLEVDYEC
ncbi:MAG: hypothetical protein ACI4I6_02410 [Hominimerdicola sp.]